MSDDAQESAEVSESSQQDGELQPDALSLDDRLEFDGHEYVVVGTGPAEATLERVNDDSYQLEISRWAFTNAVEIELKITVGQDDFDAMVQYQDGDTDA